jgi:hypothetical protein
MGLRATSGVGESPSLRLSVALVLRRGDSDALFAKDSRIDRWDASVSAWVPDPGALMGMILARSRLSPAELEAPRFRHPTGSK